MVSTRSCWLAIALTFTTIPVAAQTAPDTPPQRDRLDYGVRFGPSFTTLTSVDAIDATAAPAAFEPTLNFGGFATFRVRGPLAFQPEILFAAKGHRIRDKNARPITTPTGEQKLPSANRVILIRYLEIPLLLRLSKRTHENTSFYVIAGPSFGRRRNAVIRQVSDPGLRTDVEDLVASTDLSYIAGGGVQYERWLVDARVVRGMRNIATDAATAVKTGAFSVLMGVRF